jgi:uncharacterized protein YodC (DUF2158 family)
MNSRTGSDGAMLDRTLDEPRFKIGQDVHLKTGSPEMIVNQCTQAPDGGFIVDTIWFGEGGSEKYGTYQEGELEARISKGRLTR